MVEIFTDDMDESQIIKAFSDSLENKKEDQEKVEEKETNDEPNKEEMEQPSEETVVEADEQTIAEDKEESASDVLDFASPVMIKDRDVEFPANSSKELLDLARMGLNFTRKTQELSKHKGTIDYMSQHGITNEMLQTMVEASTGNKEALGSIAKKAGIDTLEVDPETPYTPDAKYAPQQYTEVDMVANEIQADSQTADSFRSLMDIAPQSFKETLGTNADTLRKFGVDVKNGIAKELMPEAVKLHALYGGDFVNHYITASRMFNENFQPEQIVESVAEVKTEPSPNRAKAGVASSSSTGSSSGSFDVWSATDEELMEKINSLSK